ncbi:hypothetical protein HZH68_010935 [Vespula germanica]|uniref:Uncharacterized protein n=1 Tax=Vespula germanica TaxID=30212 RepID=A0A834JTG5_VESGE|nr:hypothetical protein HZH68_010935 [Vespula germanica]
MYVLIQSEQVLGNSRRKSTTKWVKFLVQRVFSISAISSVSTPREVFQVFFPHWGKWIVMIVLNGLERVDTICWPNALHFSGLCIFDRS